MPPHELYYSIFSKRNKALWRSVQDEGELSYNSVGPAGNFSDDSYEPGTTLGSLIARHGHGLCLDVGCGLLPRPVYMRDAKQCQFMGIDPIATGNAKFYGRREFPFAQAIGDYLPFRRESFDCVIFSSSIDHQFSPKKALREARRVLKPGGLLFVVETIRPNDTAYRRWKVQATLLGMARYNRFHCWAFTAKSLPRLIESAGFEVIQTDMVASAEMFVLAKVAQLY